MEVRGEGSLGGWRHCDTIEGLELKYSICGSFSVIRNEASDSITACLPSRGSPLHRCGSSGGPRSASASARGWRGWTRAPRACCGAR